MYRNKVVNNAVTIGDKVLERLVDIALIGVFFNLEYVNSGGKAHRAGNKADNDLDQVNYQTIKRSLTYLRKNGLIQTIKEEKVKNQVTQKGRQKLNLIIPQHDNKRAWDDKIYLVTYDLPVNNNRERGYLRDYLRTIGCGMLQQSLWLTPFNPTDILNEFKAKHNLDSGLIIVSSLGRDGVIGNTEWPELMTKVFPINKINQQYYELIYNYNHKIINRQTYIIEYLKILAGDPQLPFKLLPNDWFGEQANEIFEKTK